MVRPLCNWLLLASCALCGTMAAIPALAADGETLITQSKALAGDVTPGDTPGFPVTITEPGSYKLASNLDPGRRDGIVVTAPDVTIDLNGFRISGGPAGGANNAQIGIWGKSDRLTVKNGTLGAFASAGIEASSRHYLIVENMRIVNGANFGIRAGDAARIQNNTVASNLGYGVVCRYFCHVEGNVVSGNGYGVGLYSGSVLGNTILSNTGQGITAVGVASDIGFGNNTLVGNNGGGAQTFGTLGKLHPNNCSPTAC